MIYFKIGLPVIHELGNARSAVGNAVTEISSSLFWWQYFYLVLQLPKEASLHCPQKGYDSQVVIHTCDNNEKEGCINHKQIKIPA